MVRKKTLKVDVTRNFDFSCGELILIVFRNENYN